MHGSLKITVLILSCIIFFCSSETFSELLESRMKNLADNLHKFVKLDVQWILDVGANHGDWTKGIALKNFPNASIFMIEGNKALRKHLSVIGHQYEIALVSNITTNVTFHVHKRYSTGGSMLKEHLYKKFRDTDILKYNTMTRKIDSIIEERKVGPFQLMKMDVQGVELPALQGAIQTLKNIHVAIVEVSLQQYNPGSASFHDLNCFFKSQNFRLYDIVDLHNFKEQGYMMVQLDAVWVKENSPLWKQFPEPPLDTYTC